MRILITGAGGFVGRHLVDCLRHAHPTAELHGTYFNPPDDAVPVTPHPLDLCDEDATRSLIQQVRPNQIYHLAGQAAVGRSFSAPWETLENNIRAQLNIFLGVIDAAIDPRMLIISSGEIYDSTLNADFPFDENTPLVASTPYGVSKITQEMLALQYQRSHALTTLRVRPFNHFGPGQRPGFVIPDFATQIAQIEAGLQIPVIQVGNLAAERDFTDVRDVVRAYQLFMACGQPGQVVNVASGRLVSIRQILDALVAQARVPIAIEIDPGRTRPIGQARTWGDARLLRQITDWQPRYSLVQTLHDVLSECRARFGLPFANLGSD